MRSGEQIGLRGSKRRVTLVFPPKLLASFRDWSHAHGWTFSNGIAAAGCFFLTLDRADQDRRLQAARSLRVKRICADSWPAVMQERVLVELRKRIAGVAGVTLSDAFAAAMLALQTAVPAELLAAIEAANCFGEE